MGGIGMHREAGIHHRKIIQYEHNQYFANMDIFKRDNT